MKTFFSALILTFGSIAFAGGGGAPSIETVDYRCGHHPVYEEIQIIRGAGMDYRLNSTDKDFTLWEPSYGTTEFLGPGIFKINFISKWTFVGTISEGVLTDLQGNEYICNK